MKTSRLKKFLIFSLALFLCIGLSGCSKKKNNPKKKKTELQELGDDAYCLHQDKCQKRRGVKF